MINEVEAVQFTLTEVGSVPGTTFVVHRVRGPNGRTITVKSGIPTKLTPAYEKAKGKGKGITGFAAADTGTAIPLVVAFLGLVAIGVILVMKRKQ